MSQEFVPTPSLLTCDAFAPHVGEQFTVIRVDGIRVELELISAEMLPLKPFDGRAVGKAGFVRTDPFVLLFRGAETAIPRQGLYRFSHPSMGEFQMAVVPVGPGETGWQFEAIFN